MPARLTEREIRIADLLLEGCENAEIAKTLHMKVRTVKKEFHIMFLKYGIDPM